MLAESPRGLNDLYVALTRATQRVGVVHEGPLPAVRDVPARHRSSQASSLSQVGQAEGQSARGPGGLGVDRAASVARPTPRQLSSSSRRSPPANRLNSRLPASAAPLATPRTAPISGSALRFQESW